MIKYVLTRTQIRYIADDADLIAAASRDWNEDHPPDEHTKFSLEDAKIYLAGLGWNMAEVGDE